MRRRDFIVIAGSAAATWPLSSFAQQGGRARRIGVLMGLVEGSPEAAKYLSTFKEALRALGWTGPQNVQIDYRAAAELEAMRSHAIELGFIVMPNVFTALHRDRIVPRAARFRIPTIYPLPHFFPFGALISEGSV